MRFSPYSFSKINTFTMCPKKFEYSYIEKLKVFVPNMATERGSYIHTLLENDTKSKPTTFKFTLIDDEMQKECINIYEKFKETDLGRFYFYPEAQAEVEFGMKKENGKLVVCSYYDKGALFRGKIDHFIKDDDTKTIFVVDFKTGKVSAFPAPLQLVMYAVWSLIMYPDIDKVSASFVYVEHEDEEKVYNFKREHLVILTKKVLENIIRIEKSESFPKKESKLCDYCEYRKRGICTETTQDDFQESMVNMIKPYERKRKLYFYIHPESDCAWIQDYEYDGKDGNVEEVDETFFLNLGDFGYSEESIDKTIHTKDNK